MASRCARHELAVGPDGLCVLCRREASAARAPGERRPPIPWIPVVAFALVVGVGVAVWRGAEPRVAVAPSPPQPSPGRAEAEPAPVAERSLPEVKEPIRPEPAGPAATAVPEDEVRAPSPASAKPRAPNAEELQAALGEVRITIYTTTWCPHCTRARAWLRANNLRHTEYDVEASESARRERDRISPRRGVPTADIDGEVLTGFGERSWSAAIARATQRRLEQRQR
ncbi:MAG: hypothetical protein IPM35_30785 [Myxococcales bacterium]|nr:hypothetical protein [Myxococcales bacterium]